MTQPRPRLCKVLIVSPYFYPENFRINDVARDLQARGHQVEVLTGQPNYPHPSAFVEFRRQKIRQQDWAGIKIHRVPIITRGNGGGARRIWNYISFVLSGGWWVFCDHLRRPPAQSFDAVVTWASSPITSALPSILLRTLRPCAHAIWVQDLWPETLESLGTVKSPRVLRFLGKLSEFIYRRSDLIWGQSAEMSEAIRARVPEHPRIHVLHNWADLVIPAGEKPPLAPDPRLKILYTGNLGQAQGLAVLLNAIQSLGQEKILWTFVGDGSLANWLRSEILRRNLGHCVQVLPAVHRSLIRHYADWADILLLTLDSAGCFAQTIPSKLQTYMSWQKPLLGFVEGATASVIKSHDCGLTASPRDPEAFRQAVQTFLQMSAEKRQTLAQNAFRGSIRTFSKQSILDTLEADLLSIGN